MAQARIERYRRADGEWGFRVVAANNEKVLQGEGYSDPDGMLPAFAYIVPLPIVDVDPPAD